MYEFYSVLLNIMQDDDKNSLTSGKEICTRDQLYFNEDICYIDPKSALI